PARLPYKAMLLVTWRCQARCRMCNIWKRAPEQEFSLDEWSMFFQRNPYLQWLTLSGGEPFLRGDIAEIVRLALEFCPKLYCINMPTNGLAPEIIKKTVTQILALNVPKFMLSISVDGPEKIHDKIRGIPGAWQRAISIFQWARKIENENSSRFSVMLEHTLLPDSYGRFEEMFRQIKAAVPEVKAADIMVTIGSVSRHYYGNTANDELHNPADNCRALESALREIITLRRKEASIKMLYLFTQFFLEMAIRYTRTGIPPLHCRAARSSVFIDPCGFMYPCNSYTRPLGSLRDNDYSIEKVFAGNNMSKIRADIDELKCGGCWTACEASLSVAENIINPLWAWQIIKSGWFCN
ncbi:MAG: radical SAM protein, partial [Kiritimatiellia bacterium]|nr:radical SAM protein [Kiritimatiellia bacterium]